MRKKHRLRRRCYLLLYDKPKINQKALRFYRSLEEIKKLLLSK